MKQKSPIRVKMRTFFTLLIIVEIIAIVALSSVILFFLHKFFHIPPKIPDSVILIAFSFVLGCGVTTAISQFIFAPISKLSSAMRKVAEGDFSVRLSENKRFNEIRQINTDFNIMAKELGATEILQTDFVSNVSHEFKTPISAIEGYATLLRGSDCTDEQNEYAEKILFNTKRLSSLVGNILLLSKVDNRGIPAQKVEYRLDEQIRQSILSLESLWLEKETEFDVDLERVTYSGNEALMQHVWNNLIENAVKFGDLGALVCITLARSDDKIVFMISDNGPGIPEASLTHIFDRFYQADSSHKSEGNGLGLALVKQILKLEGGSISVKNIESGGCCFTVTL